LKGILFVKWNAIELCTWRQKYSSFSRRTIRQEN